MNYGHLFYFIKENDLSICNGSSEMKEGKGRWSPGEHHQSVAL